MVLVVTNQSHIFEEVNALFDANSNLRQLGYAEFTQMVKTGFERAPQYFVLIDLVNADSRVTEMIHEHPVP